jgi:serine/threonine protein phosphatase 1
MITYAIGDIHGHYKKLCQALAWIHGRGMSPVRIVSLGDYIDRGPDSRRVLKRLMAGPERFGDEWICLKGNHEDMMVTCLAGLTRMSWWLGNGGQQTMDSYEAGRIPDEVVRWCGGLPTSYQSEHFFFCHAGINPGRSLADQDDEALLWIRDRFLKHDQPFEKHIVHGHTPAIEPEEKPNRTNLDTGMGYGRKLSVGVFSDENPGGPLMTKSF